MFDRTSGRIRFIPTLMEKIDGRRWPRAGTSNSSLTTSIFLNYPAPFCFVEMVSTRAENAAKTPGVVARPRARRTAEQVAAEKAEKKAKGVAAKAEHDAKVKRIADLREQLRLEEAAVTTPILERVTPKRKQRAAEEEHGSEDAAVVDGTDYEGSEGTGGASVPPESEEEPIDAGLGKGVDEYELEDVSGDESGDYEPDFSGDKSGDESDAGKAMDVDEDESQLLSLPQMRSKGSYKVSCDVSPGLVIHRMTELLCTADANKEASGKGAPR